jgi:hypothetical protein
MLDAWRGDLSHQNQKMAVKIQSRADLLQNLGPCRLAWDHFLSGGDHAIR